VPSSLFDFHTISHRKKSNSPSFLFLAGWLVLFGGAFFFMSWGPLTSIFVITAELFPTKWRATGVLHATVALCGVVSLLRCVVWCGVFCFVTEVAISVPTLFVFSISATAVFFPLSLSLPPSVSLSYPSLSIPLSSSPLSKPNFYFAFHLPIPHPLKHTAPTYTALTTHTPLPSPVRLRHLQRFRQSLRRRSSFHLFVRPAAYRQSNYILFPLQIGI
jgi:hypothetical protein